MNTDKLLSINIGAKEDKLIFIKAKVKKHKKLSKRLLFFLFQIYANITETINEIKNALKNKTLLKTKEKNEIARNVINIVKNKKIIYFSNFFILYKPYVIIIQLK